MAKKKVEYIPGESFEEEPQQFANGSPVMEGYNPADSDLPYIPAMPSQQHIKQPQFIDLNNPESFARVERQNPQQPQQANPYTAYKTGPNGEIRPNLENASQNKEQLGSIFDEINGIASTSTIDGSDVKSYATGIAIKTMYDAIKILNEVDYWIPEGKEQYTEPLKRVSASIIKALQAYVSKIEQLK